MRRLLFVAVLLALAAPAMADAKPPCEGERFRINGKDICVVENEPLAISKADDSRPRLKLSGHLMANDMMVTEFDPAPLTYGADADDLRLADASTAATSLDGTGWGLSAQWSPDDLFWIEVGWQRPPSREFDFGTIHGLTHHFYRCGVVGLCPYKLDEKQADHHRFTVDDVTLALKWDTTPKSKYVSVLLGAGVHRRYLHHWADTATTRREVWYDVYDEGPARQLVKTTEESHRRDRTTQTRLFGLAEFELYPAGKDRFVGVGISARILGDGRKEQQYFTDTLLDRNIMMGIEPGFYDVTARLILRF